MQQGGTRIDRGTGRFTRGLTMSAACLVIPTVAHAAAGGGIPVHGGILFFAALLSIGCVALADRRRTGMEITTMLLVTQPVFHILLSAGSHHGTDAIVPGTAMIAAHTAAVVVLATLLTGAETTVWSLAALSATVLLTWTRRFAGSPRTRLIVPQPIWPRASVQKRHICEIVSSAPRRGPPVAA